MSAAPTQAQTDLSVVFLRGFYSQHLPGLRGTALVGVPAPGTLVLPYSSGNDGRVLSWAKLVEKDVSHQISSPFPLSVVRS